MPHISSGISSLLKQVKIAHYLCYYSTSFLIMQSSQRSALHFSSTELFCRNIPLNAICWKSTNFSPCAAKTAERAVRIWPVTSPSAGAFPTFPCGDLPVFDLLFWQFVVLCLPSVHCLWFCRTRARRKALWWNCWISCRNLCEKNPRILAFSGAFML